MEVLSIIIVEVEADHGTIKEESLEEILEILNGERDLLQARVPLWDHKDQDLQSIETIGEGEREI